MKLLVIILNYRVTDLTIDCLKTVVPELPRVPGIKVAVCENGTGGDAEERIREAIVTNGLEPWVELTAISPNRGFTGGNNVVIRKALASQNPPDTKATEGPRMSQCRKGLESIMQKWQEQD